MIRICPSSPTNTIASRSTYTSSRTSRSRARQHEGHAVIRQQGGDAHDRVRARPQSRPPARISSRSPASVRTTTSAAGDELAVSGVADDDRSRRAGQTAQGGGSRGACPPCSQAPDRRAGHAAPDRPGLVIRVESDR